VVRTRVGYCGGALAEPTYRKVCNDEAFGDYAETIQLEFDGAELSYEDVLAAFFRSHDAERRGKARQYQSVIFVHDAFQRDVAMAALERYPAAHTKLEVATDFWDAEPYHQKWLLQRKRDIFMTLGMTDTAQLLEAPATTLNAYAAGKLRADVAAERLARHGVDDDVLDALFA
jgi:peptide-methionine (S)-S-oxide reductase